MKKIHQEFFRSGKKRVVIETLSNSISLRRFPQGLSEVGSHLCFLLLLWPLEQQFSNFTVYHMPPGDLLQGKFLGPAPEPGKVCGWVGGGGEACSTCESACLTSSSWSFGGCGLGDPLWETPFFSCGQEDTLFLSEPWGLCVEGKQWGWEEASVIGLFILVQSLSHVRLCDPMDCSTPGFPLHHQLLEFTQTHVHWVGDAIQQISFSVVPFSSHLQSFPATESFQMSQFFASGGQSTGVSASASVLLMNIQDWFPLGWTGWIRYALSPSPWLSESWGGILVLVVTSLPAASYEDLFSEEDLILAIPMHLYPGVCISNPGTVKVKGTGQC